MVWFFASCDADRSHAKLARWIARLPEGYRQRDSNDDYGHEHCKSNASTIVATGLVSHGNTSSEVA
jgi:hypothetical protein